jgi:hypothetical protein
MIYRFVLFLFIVLLLTPVPAAEFNIKLRKTDINELKQQLLPAFDQNVEALTALLNCLEKGQLIDDCIDQLSIKADVTDKDKQARQQQIKQDIKQQLNNQLSQQGTSQQKHSYQEKNQQDKLIAELKVLLVEVEKVRRCLLQGQTANELKDCVVEYKK